MPFGRIQDFGAGIWDLGDLGFGVFGSWDVAPPPTRAPTAAERGRFFWPTPPSALRLGGTVGAGLKVPEVSE